jgi:hypothetical protein
MSTGSGKTEVAMRGGGYYSLATAGARDVIDAATPLVLSAIDSLPVGGGPFTLSDMGCADGGTSLNMIEAAIRAVQKRRPGTDVSVVYTDQPRNDFNALFQILSGASDFRSYLQDLDNVYVTACGTSFHDQMLPAGTLDFGFSATAMHWLSRKPANISDHVHAVGASGDELKAFQQQGADDWQRILLHRAAEMKPGAKLVLCNFGIDEQGRYLGNTGGVNMFDQFNDIWQSMIDDGTISAQEYAAMTLPQYYHSVDEFSAPLLDKSSLVYRAGLRLESIHTGVTPCPYAADFQKHQDASRFAREYIPTLRSWNESTYFAGLAAERPLQEREAIIERFYGTYQHRVAASPAGHAMDYVHAYIVIAKES